eukprot:1950836-Rhodomonas_salina.3
MQARLPKQEEMLPSVQVSLHTRQDTRQEVGDHNNCPVKFEEAKPSPSCGTNQEISTEDDDADSDNAERQQD